MAELPSYYDPASVDGVWIERAGVVAEAAVLARRSGAVRPAASDRRRIAAFGIDCQIGFSTPGASLFVPGAVEDTRRTVEWIYRNLGALTELVFSLDTHAVFQVFHPAWWTNADGQHPAPFTVLTQQDVDAGVWRAVDEAAGKEYVARLARQGNYALTIWPYHTLLGGVSHALVPALAEAAIFHAIARGAATRFETKGTSPPTENYSVMRPEVTELGGETVGAFNAALLERLSSFDRVYVFGQAKSHCVLSTLRDLLPIAGKIHILTDATSPVPPPPIDPLPPELDFPRVADRAFEELAAKGMRLVKTTDPVE